MTVTFTCCKGGGVDAAIMKAQRVNIHSTRPGVKTVKGVIGNVPPHLSRESKEPRVTKMHDLYIDIGAKNRKEAASLVQIGDPIGVGRPFRFSAQRPRGRPASKLDNRHFAVAEALRLLKETKGRLQPEVCGLVCRKKSV